MSTMTIGEVIDALKACESTASVRYDFCDCVPTTVDSWRGVYAEPAIGWSPHEPGRTVAKLLVELESAIGREFTGWKGGEYRYGPGSPLHVDNRGKYTQTELVRVEDQGWHVVLHTRREEA